MLLNNGSHIWSASRLDTPYTRRCRLLGIYIYQETFTGNERTRDLIDNMNLDVTDKHDPMFTMYLQLIRVNLVDKQMRNDDIVHLCLPRIYLHLKKYRLNICQLCRMFFMVVVFDLCSNYIRTAFQRTRSRPVSSSETPYF